MEERLGCDWEGRIEGGYYSTRNKDRGAGMKRDYCALFFDSEKNEYSLADDLDKKQ
jgi:hypothetical protein